MKSRVGRDNPNQTLLVFQSALPPIRTQPSGDTGHTARRAANRIRAGNGDDAGNGEDNDNLSVRTRVIGTDGVFVFGGDLRSIERSSLARKPRNKQHFGASLDHKNVV